jgi:hypothetical protein
MLEATLDLATLIRGAGRPWLDDEFPLSARFAQLAQGSIRARLRRRG